MALLPPDVYAEFPEDREGLTPLFKQYLTIKDEHPEALLLYRLGDFYEMFGPDAVRAAGLLGLTLTQRSCRQGYKVAMCGIPHHAGARYIKRLIEAGEIAAICEQVEDPASAKGLVARAVTRVITAGTLVEDDYLSDDSANFLAVLAVQRGVYGVALLDSSSGSVELMELERGTEPGAALEQALRSYPAEVLLPENLSDSEGLSVARQAAPGAVFHTYSDLPAREDIEYFLNRYFNTNSLDSFGLLEAQAAQAALFALIRYLKSTFKAAEMQLNPRLIPLSGQLYLDHRAVAHLELLGEQRGGAGHQGSGLYGILNRCRTAAGRRKLKGWLIAPSSDAQEISSRHDAVELLISKRPLSSRLAGLLEQIQDIERITNRVCLKKTHPKELRALIDSLPPLLELKQELDKAGVAKLTKLAELMADFTGLHAALDSALAADPPVKLADSGVVRPGANQRCDELRELVHDGGAWFSRYAEEQREATGIKSLKVKQTGAFGYFIEVSKANLELVPEDYKRRQTLVNHERFTTEELLSREAEMRGAEAKLYALELSIFTDLCNSVANQARSLSASASAMAEADVLLSLAAIAAEFGWVRPRLTSNDFALELTGARHPLVEEAVGGRYYTANDCYLDQQNQQLMLITGPNMGGKSTYLRMVAILVIINQLGGFISAESARLPVFKRIYTRVGAQDSLSRGQSTFMVEMLETAQILKTCGPGSLILLDEIGRGTSTYDGISIAKAVVEHLHEHQDRPLTMFATHYFELTELELLLARLQNFQVSVARQGGQYVFLYKVEPGAASDSYGIDVAALAGLPEEVISRAREILVELESVKEEALARARHAVQLGLFGAPKGSPPPPAEGENSLSE